MRAVFYLLLVILAAGIVKYSVESAQLSDEAAHRLDLASSTELVWKSVLEKLSFNLYQGAQDERLDLSAFYVEAERKQMRAEHIAWVFLLIVAGYLGGKYALLRRMRAAKMSSAIATDCIVVAFIAFMVGIVAPVMALRAYTELPVLGTVILKYESKSVVTALSTLFDSGNWFIGCLIALFSVLLPVAKTAVSLMSLQSRKPRWSLRATRVIKAIGKWSMADVFVIAIFLAYFALDDDRFSDATIGLGLYFFAAYCLLAQFTTLYLLTDGGDGKGAG